MLSGLQLISHWVPALGLWIAKCGKVRGVRKSKSPTDTLWYVYPSGSELLCLLNSEIETQLKVNCFKETFSLTKIWMKLHKIADLKVKLYQSARILTHSFTLSDLLQKCHYLYFVCIECETVGYISMIYDLKMMKCSLSAPLWVVIESWVQKLIVQHLHSIYFHACVFWGVYPLAITG